MAYFGNNSFDRYSGSFYSGPSGEIGMVCSYGDFNVFECKVKGTTEQEMRETFEQLIDAEFAPKPNKIQKYVYGEDHLKRMDRNILKDIVDNNRGMGNTTAQAMRQVAEALKNPGKAIKLVSDHGDSGPIFSIAGGYRDVVRGIIEKLDLKFLVIRDAQRTLTYEV